MNKATADLRCRTITRPRLSNIEFSFRCKGRLSAMSDLFPQVTSDEIDPESAEEQAKRDDEIISDKPPHHQD